MRRARGPQFSLYGAIFPIIRAFGPSAHASRGRRLDRQGVDVGLEQIIDGGVDQPVARHQGNAPEGFGYDRYPEMTMSVRGSGVAGMQVTLVHDEEAGRRKTGFEAAA